MVLFVALQWLDFLTTITGFTLGAAELSPIVRSVGHVVGPLAGVLLSKVLVVWAMERMSTRGWPVLVGNFWYSGIVVWNVFILSLFH